MSALRDTWYLTARHLHTFIRQPWNVVLTLIQPIVYLLLFGALFRRIADLPGFTNTSYITFLTPGIIAVSALYTGGWLGVSVVVDLERGVLDRFLVSPVSRTALILGRLIQTALMTAIQTVILVVLAWLVGARFPGGVAQIGAMLIGGMLLTAGFGALSTATAIVVRQQESIIGMNQILLLPMTFVSTIFIARDLMPGWMQQIARFNPLDWAVQISRVADGGAIDWSIVVSRGALLMALTLGAVWLATRCFRVYQQAL
ncbi:MAG: ABC transporter permease [Thermomicrobiales bacterium]|nr:ABC transporter permease [Thermomicrobiales bacterium]